jgi:hypothetical protein
MKRCRVEILLDGVFDGPGATASGDHGKLVLGPFAAQGGVVGGLKLR